jgi:hypothetical protein
LGVVLVEARIKTIGESVDLESGSGSDPGDRMTVLPKGAQGAIVLDSKTLLMF